MNLPFANDESIPQSESLGIYVKSHVIPAARSAAVDFSYLATRVERFALQDLARSILRDMVENRSGKMTYTHQVANCLRARISNQKGVTLFYNIERERANFGNLQRCGSVWNCPVCSMTITEGRRLELSKALNSWTDSGGFAYLVTFTNSHHKGDNLADLLEGQKRAFKKLWEKTKLVKKLNDLGYVGRIVATEVTHGFNGWHPHYHMIFFFDSPIDMADVKTFLAVDWQDACIKSKLKAPDLLHGVDVRGGDYAAKYVTKWGLEYEVTKGHVKKGKNNSLTPFDLLRGCTENPQYKSLFKEFADVFKGRRQLVWSAGLKNLLGVKTVSDETLIAETEKTSVQVHELDAILWDLIIKYNQRGYVLELIENDYKNDTNTLCDFIQSLADRYLGEMLINSR